MKGQRHPVPSTPRGRSGFPIGTSERLITRRTPIRLPSLDAAERLFVEQGAFASSSRRFAETMGSTAAPHEFRTKADLVRAITRRFTCDVECTRAALIADLDGTAGIRDWLGCLVFPWTDYFARGGTTYFARVCAQAMTDPALRAVMTEEAILSPTLRQTCEALNDRLPAMPDAVIAQRSEIVQQVIVCVCAEREGAVAAGAPNVWTSWRSLGTGLVDALASIWTTPCTAGPSLAGFGDPA